MWTSSWEAWAAAFDVTLLHNVPRTATEDLQGETGQPVPLVQVTRASRAHRHEYPCLLAELIPSNSQCGVRGFPLILTPPQQKNPCRFGILGPGSESRAGGPEGCLPSPECRPQGKCPLASHVNIAQRRTPMSAADSRIPGQPFLAGWLSRRGLACM